MYSIVMTATTGKAPHHKQQKDAWMAMSRHTNSDERDNSD